MITARENLLRTYRHEEPEWAPVIALADGYNRPIHMPMSYYDDIQEMSPSRALARYFGLDCIDRVGGYSEVYTNVRHTRTLDGDIETEQWETPYGVLTQRAWRRTYPCGSTGEPDLISWARLEYPVKSADDFQAFAYVFEDMQYEFHPEEIERHVAALGDGGIVTISAPSSPLGMCVRVYMGIETVSYAYHDHRRAFCELLEAIGDNYLRCYRGIAEMPSDGTINYDDTTTYAISPRMFRELEAPFLDQTADTLHARGKLCIHHACGHVAQLLSEFRRTRIDGFDGPAAPPVGNTTVAAARAGLGDGIVIMPFTEENALKSGDPDVARRSIRTMFEQAGSPRDFVVDIVPPPAAPVEYLWPAVDEAKRLSRGFFHGVA
ncbi:MAG: hypothetical protein GX620_03750 [Chloroflexi bacterium]|nr:hypothetical protein [Chloroflexota bacterium]